MSDPRFDANYYQLDHLIEDQKRRLSNAIRLTLERHTEQQLIEWLVALPEPHRTRVLKAATGRLLDGATHDEAPK